MNRTIARLMALTLIAIGLVTVSVGMAVAADKDAGKSIYGPRGGYGCIACHGINGKRAIQDYPNIAGQDKKYIEQQIKDIMNGKRVGSPNAEGKPRTEGMKGSLVTPQGKPRMDNAQIKQVAAWLAGQEPAAPKAPETPYDPARLENGKGLYKKYNCKNCHGNDGLKPLKGYPFIAGQKRDYLIAQMKDIRDKVRKNGKSGVMVGFVKKASDEDIEVIAEYLSQINRAAK
ncbi:MAG: cytochrome c4 [Rhodospirillales bacterium]|nr:cytochrome c4 [Rhodospirillales bacterium]MCW8863058.1 cytochrome c4 [Rhodospirillales bacterium]MCW8951415.1 cytochrome c4 [Rhodospirillales bacterium]MCW8970240.1 cytochrome c4 [Rhodospirillales bacterium]MCW9001953.1 cytochrome c4 [Rhodospirillales bacterium]